MGLKDALVMKRVAYACQQVIEFADYVQEAISYHAIFKQKAGSRTGQISQL